MRDVHVLVAGPEASSASVARALRDRQLLAWSDRLERVLGDGASIGWADIVVLFYDAHLLESVREDLAQISTPKVLLSHVPLTTLERAALIEEYGFEYVIAWPAPADLVAAFVERAAHRGVLPLRYLARA